LLRETPEGLGTAVVTLPTGTDPFCRLRVPEITEQWAAERAAATACHRRDPGVLAHPLTELVRPADTAHMMLALTPDLSVKE
jgi:hypothetical protein